MRGPHASARGSCDTAGRRALYAALIAAACAACPGKLDDPARFEDGSAASCPDVPQDVLATTCGVSNCHSSAAKTQGLDLQSPDPASRLVGVPATEGSGLLIDPSNPLASVLYTKITATPPFGGRMPFGKTALDSTTVACVLSWIMAQAQPEGGSGDDGGPPSGDGAPAEGSTPEASPPHDSGSPPADASSDARHDATSGSSGSSSSSSSGGSTSSGSSGSSGGSSGSGSSGADGAAADGSSG